MKIGESVDFAAVFEDEVFNAVRSRGTISDIRDGVAYAFVLGYRWPFAIRVDDEVKIGFYPLTASDGRSWT